MQDQSRKLLPYEHQMIEALGITREEYLDFVAQQHIYQDIKQGTVVDAQNDFGLTALILTIVGTLIQVAAALLAPKPQLPGAPSGQRQQTRDDRFAPRFGFNTVQDLAQYGDPINLIYTNTETNPNGGVRVATSLLWSSVKSFGSSQYVQLLLLLGAGGIGRIDADRTAFGQTSVRNLISQNYWLYFRPSSTGIIRGSDLVAGGNGETDPAATNVGSRNLYRINPAASDNSGDGFSRALSPATANQFGGYSPVPLNVAIIIRNEEGGKESVLNGISVAGLNNVWGPSAGLSRNGKINVGDSLSIVLAATDSTFAKQVEEEAADHRRAMSSAFDNAAIFKLGSAKFTMVSTNRGSTDSGSMTATLRCIEAGLAPSLPYSTTVAEDTAKDVANSDPVYQSLKATVDGLLKEAVTGATPASLLAAGKITEYRTVTTPGFSSKFGGYPSRTTTTEVDKRQLTTNEKNILREYINYQTIVADGTKSDDLFFIKALVKIEKASYETSSACHIVDFALKARVYRRISGRQEKYGTKEQPGYPISDNGVKLRTSMFLVKYKKASAANFSYVKGIFVVRRAADNDNFVYFRFNSGKTGVDLAENWRFEMEPVHDPVAEFKQGLLNVGTSYRFFYLENSSSSQGTISLEDGASITFVGDVVNSLDMMPPRNNSPIASNEWDLFSNTADTQLQTSFDNGPEFVLAAVTEQIVESFANFPSLYDDLSLAGFNLYSGRNIQDLRSLTLFVTQGRQSRLLRTSGTFDGIAWGRPGYQYLPPTANGFPNTAPDIFIDTVLDLNDGIGKFASLHSVDVESLARSKKFCEKNSLFMDGVIADRIAWRQFWSSTAGFSLLELAKIGGQDTLVPAVPFNSETGEITNALTISALFNAGNILEDSYKEEFVDYGSNSQDITARVIYRENERDGVFPRNRSVDIRLSDASEDLSVLETVDTSAFVCRRDQAIKVGKLLCLLKRHSRRAIEFKTFPTDSPVFPGAYIYVDLGQNEWNRVYSGIIEPGGILNSPATIPNGQYSVLVYEINSSSAMPIANVQVNNGMAPSLAAAHAGKLFVLGHTNDRKRVFRVTEVNMDEEGEVTVRASQHPTDASGNSLIGNGFLQKSFMIDGKAE